jgi:transcription elongation factor GreB
MSKAFTKDEGEGSAAPPPRPAGPPLPEGSKNYLTPSGLTALRQRLREAEQAVEGHRARRATSEQARAQEQLEFLTRRLEVSEVVVAPVSAEGPIRFGAIVETVDSEGRRRRFHIVGIDEAAPAEGHISWTSPMARALLGRQVGDDVSVRTPQGPLDLEILTVSYA